MEPRDEVLWIIAKKRVGFKWHLLSYLIVNTYLWGVWLVTGREFDQQDYLPWPLWVMLFWGIGLVLNYINAYVLNTGNAVEKEYRKLKNQQ
jgi:hypothetical protein